MTNPIITTARISVQDLDSRESKTEYTKKPMTLRYLDTSVECMFNTLQKSILLILIHITYNITIM